MKRLITLSMSTVFLLIFALMAAGCGGSENGAGDAGDKAPEATEQASKDDLDDACKIVTQEDAAKLFGQPASRSESGSIVVDPNMEGECLWSYDTDTGSQLIQFRIWDGEQYYGGTPDSEDFDIGEKGSISVNSFLGVDIQWVQDGKTIDLSYFTTGSGVPDAETKVEEVKAMAKEASGRL